jgi:hypothetical protein
MSLFQQLLNLHSGKRPEENFFTEVFVSILSRNKEILPEFLTRFLDISQNYAGYEVKSQVDLPPLSVHDHGSRPDVEIKLYHGESGMYDLVMIESKIRSIEGKNQLERYAEQLLSDGHARNRYLLYITRFYDYKDFPGKKYQDNGNMTFKQLRWREFYTLLKGFCQDSLVAEAVSFMEENGMTDNVQLKSTDLADMKSFPRIFEFMFKSLEDEIEKKFTRIIGEKRPSPQEFIYQLRENHCFVYSASAGIDWWFGIGYFWQGQDDDPSIGLNIEIDADSTRWNEIAMILKQVVADSYTPVFVWKSYDLEKQGTYAGIWILESLSSLGDGPDLLDRVRNRFSLYLDQVEIIKTKYPSLPWPSRK